MKNFPISHGVRFDDRNSVLLSRLLRPYACRTREQQTGREIARPHSITSSAVASSAGEMLRPNALAVFRLITSSYLVG